MNKRNVELKLSIEFFLELKEIVQFAYKRFKRNTKTINRQRFNECPFRLKHIIVLSFVRHELH